MRKDPAPKRQNSTKSLQSLNSLYKGEGKKQQSEHKREITESIDMILFEAPASDEKKRRKGSLSDVHSIYTKASSFEDDGHRPIPQKLQEYAPHSSHPQYSHMPDQPRYTQFPVQPSHLNLDVKPRILARSAPTEKKKI